MSKTTPPPRGSLLAVQRQGIAGLDVQSYINSKKRAKQGIIWASFAVYIVCVMQSHQGVQGVNTEYVSFRYCMHEQSSLRE